MARRNEIGGGGGKRRRSALARVMGGLFGLIAIAALAAGGLGFAGYSMMQAEGPLERSKVVLVETGTGTNEIGQLLETEGVIRTGWLFALAARVSTVLEGSVIKAGEYEIAAGTSALGVLKLLQSGKTLFYKLSVPEGFTTEQALTRVIENPKLEGDLTLKPEEGALLPDTYVFRHGMTRDKLVQQMIDARTKLLDELWPERAKNLPLRSKEEAIILASIVEKETGIAAERPDVAAVFINRLRAGMRLQSDPTIIYGIVGGKAKLDRPIRRSDIDARTPYNTYQIDGLPPTPISNPGREAIAAVLKPSGSKALYFVADGSGGHAFANTLEEHRKNVKQWRKVESERNAADDASTDTSEAKPAETVSGQQAATDVGTASAAPGTQTTSAPAEQVAPAPGQAPAAAVDEAPMPIPGTESTAAAADTPSDTASGQTAAVATPVASASDNDLPLLEPADPRALVKVAGREIPLPRPRPEVR